MQSQRKAQAQGSEKAGTGMTEDLPGPVRGRGRREGRGTADEASRAARSPILRGHEAHDSNTI